MKMKRIVSTLLTGAILITGICGIESAGSAGQALGITKAASAAGTKWPSGPKKSKLSSDSAIVMELSTGTVLYEKNIHKQHYPASITKIMTSLLVLEQSSLSETVTFSEDAVYGIESGSSTIYSEVGEKMTIEQCLYAIMLESANEVCLAVGEHVAGTSKKFVNQMNQKVANLGLKNTHFNNPNGLPDPKHYTTAYDMAVIAREAMKSSAFRKITNTRTYTCAKTNKHKVTRVWNNHHQMINGYKQPQYEYKYCIGGKTGYTNIARNTLVTYAEKNGMELVCVIMKGDNPEQGEPNEYTDSTSLLNFGFEKYQKYTLNEDNTELNAELFNNYGSYFNAEESPVHLAAGSTIVLPKGVELSAAKQSISYDNAVKLQDGDNVIGKVTYSYGKRTVGSSDIIYTMSEQTNHLDEASRSVIGDEISNIESTNEKTRKQRRMISKVVQKIRGFFQKVGSALHNQLLGSIIIIGIALLLIFVLALLLRRLTPGQRRKRATRRSGGRKHHARIKKQKNQLNFSAKSGRRNYSKHYNKTRSSGKQKRKRNKGVQYHKRHKHTRESFGKNFFDF